MGPSPPRSPGGPPPPRPPLQLFRETLQSQGFIEVHTPKLLSGASEGGAAVFHFDYMGRPGCLAQSPQFYKQMAICSDLGRVYEIGPVFRAENSYTHRHLCEFTGLDMEMAIAESYHEVLDVLDALFVHMFQVGNEPVGRAGQEAGRGRREADCVGKARAGLFGSSCSARCIQWGRKLGGQTVGWCDGREGRQAGAEDRKVLADCLAGRRAGGQVAAAGFTESSSPPPWPCAPLHAPVFFARPHPVQP